MANRRKKTDAKAQNGANTTGVTPKSKSDKRFRVQFRFWLDGNKALERDMGIRLEQLTKQRKYAKFMRDSIQLMLSLMIGDVLMLCSLFPGVVEAIQQEARSILMRDNARLIAQNEALQNIIQQQEARIAELEHQVSSKKPSASDEFLALVRSAVRDEIRQSEPAFVEAAPAPDIPQAIGLKALQPVGSGSNANTGNSSAVGLKGIQGKHVTMSIPLPDDDDSDEPLFEVKQHIGDGSANRRFIQALLDLQKSSGKAN